VIFEIMREQTKPTATVVMTRSEQLLREASAELNARGVGNTSLSAIARRLGVTRAALYYYVKDQEDLVFQCYRRTCAVTGQRLSNAEKAADTPLACIDAFVDSMLGSDEPEVAAIWELGYLTGEKHETIDRELHGVVTHLSQILQDGIETGSIRQCNTFHVARTILGIVSWPSLFKRIVPELQEAIPKQLSPKVSNLLKFGVASDRHRVPSIDIIPLQNSVLQASQIFTLKHVTAAKKESLLAAGSRILNEKGVDATSLDEIAESLGISKTAIYQNIGDKQTFIAECLRRSFDMFIRATEQMEEAPGTRLAAAASVVHLICRMHLDADGPMVFPMVGFESLPEPIVSEMGTRVHLLESLWRQAYTTGCSEGSFRQLDIDLTIALTAAYSQWTTQWRRETNAAVAEDIATEVTNLWCVGLANLATS
jgi:AcrR family transcriptional regulator